MLISCPMIHQTLAITPVAFANFMTGISVGWLSPVLQNHRNSNGELSFTDKDCTWMVTAQSLGCFLGNSVLILVTDRFGRNSVILLSAVVALISWIGVALTKKVIILELSRLAAGISVGINSVILSIYIGENSSPNVRGVFNSGAGLFMDVGMILSSTVTTYCSYEISAYIFVAASIVNLLSGSLLREPAQHLLATGLEASAESRFFWLRGRNEETQREFNDIKTNMDVEKPKFSLTFIFEKQFRIIGAILVFAVLTGSAPVYYLVSIILLPTKQFSSNELTILFDIFQLIGSITSPFIIDRYRRRTLWMLSAILVTVTHIFTAALYICKEKQLEIPNNEWLLFGSITAYGMIYGTLMYPLGMILGVELLPQKSRTIGVSILRIVYSLMEIIEVYCFLWVANSFGIQVDFVCFTLSSLMVLVLCYFYLPETKGKSLSDIEKIYSTK